MIGTRMIHHVFLFNDIQKHISFCRSQQAAASYGFFLSTCSSEMETNSITKVPFEVLLFMQSVLSFLDRGPYSTPLVHAYMRIFLSWISSSIIGEGIHMWTGISMSMSDRGPFFFFDLIRNALEVEISYLLCNIW